MRLQLPTIIFLCLSLIVVVPLIYYMQSGDQATREAINLEGQEFKSLREQAAVAHNAKRHTAAIQIYEEALKMRQITLKSIMILGQPVMNMGLITLGRTGPLGQLN